MLLSLDDDRRIDVHKLHTYPLDVLPQLYELREERRMKTSWMRGSPYPRPWRSFRAAAAQAFGVDMRRVPL